MSNLPAPLAGRPIDHIAIAVPDLEAASGPYRALGLAQEGPDEVIAAQQVRVRVFRAAGSLVELLEPTSPDGPVARFLGRRGPGLHHVAFASTALEEDIERLLASGAEFVDPTPRPGRAGSRVVFLHPRWTGGVLLELVAHD